MTPADLIHGILTECGPVPKSASGSFSVVDFLAACNQQPCHSAGKAGKELPNGNATDALEKQAQQDGTGFVALDVDSVKTYLAGIPHLCSRLGPPASMGQWKVSGADCWGLLHCIVLPGIDNVGSCSPECKGRIPLRREPCNSCLLVGSQ